MARVAVDRQMVCDRLESSTEAQLPAANSSEQQRQAVTASGTSQYNKRGERRNGPFSKAQTRIFLTLNKKGR